MPRNPLEHSPQHEPSAGLARYTSLTPHLHSPIRRRVGSARREARAGRGRWWACSRAPWRRRMRRFRPFFWLERRDFATSPSLNFVLRIFVDAALPACAVGSCVRVSCSTNSWLCAGMRCMCAGSRGKISFTFYPPYLSALQHLLRPSSFGHCMKVDLHRSMAAQWTPEPRARVGPEV